MKTKITMSLFTELCKRDFNDFQQQFGEERLNQLIQQGNLPLRRETVEFLRNDKRFGKIDYTKFL